MEVNVEITMIKQELGSRVETVLGGLGGRLPNSNFSELLELSETSRARKLICWLQVNRQGQQSQISCYPVDGI